MNKELPKGVCPSCWGKKYNSVMNRETGMGDFPGDQNYDSGSHIYNIPCPKCNGTGKFPTQEPMEWTEKIEDEFMDLWDSKKSSLGLGNYSSDITQFWLNKIKQAEERTKQEVERIVKAGYDSMLDQKLMEARAEGYEFAREEIKLSYELFPEVSSKELLEMGKIITNQ